MKLICKFGDKAVCKYFSDGRVYDARYLMGRPDIMVRVVEDDKGMERIVLPNDISFGFCEIDYNVAVKDERYGIRFEVFPDAN